MTLAINLTGQEPVEGNVDRPETVRQTLLRHYDNCPHSAYLYLKLGGGTPSHAKTRGTAVHLVAERCENLMIEQGEPTIPGDIATEIADAVMAEHPEWVLRAEDQDVVRGCSYNWAESTVVDLEAMVGSEVPMKIELGGFTVTGTIDRLEATGQTAFLHDRKTSLNIRTKEEVEKSFQGKLYSLLVLFGVHRETEMPLGAGLQDVFFYEEYPRYRTDEGPLVTREAVWSRAEIYEFKTSLERMLASFEHSLETGIWEARDGSWCGECPAQRLCPIPAELREMPEITTQQEAEELLEIRLRNKREGAAMQKALREWVKATEEPIIAGDHAFAAREEQVRKVKDWDEFLMAVARTEEFKVPLMVEDHIDIRVQTKFDSKKVTKGDQE